LGEDSGDEEVSRSVLTQKKDATPPRWSKGRIGHQCGSFEKQKTGDSGLSGHPSTPKEAYRTVTRLKTGHHRKGPVGVFK